MLKLAPISYLYGKQKSNLQSKTADTYYIKGIRGALRHKVMALCYQAGVEVCHTMELRLPNNSKKLDLLNGSMKHGHTSLRRHILLITNLVVQDVQRHNF